MRELCYFASRFLACYRPALKPSRSIGNNHTCFIPVYHLSRLGRPALVGPMPLRVPRGDNDPHGEHDFGAFAVDAVKCIFKFDCYDLKLENGSEGPSDPTKTCLIPTLLLAEHY